MSIFSTLFKRKPKTPADTTPQPLTLEQGIQRAQHIYQQNTLYTLLSLTQADMRNGLSQPYIGALKDGRSVLFLFDRYEDAKAFLANGYEILDGVYPVGKITVDDTFNNLQNVMAIANTLGISLLSHNAGTPNQFECEISWFCQVNQVPNEIKIQFPDQELNDQQESTTLPPRFNSLEIVDYTNPYYFTPAEVDDMIGFLQQAEKDAIIHFLMNNSVAANVVLADAIERQSQEAANIVKKVMWYQLSLLQPIYLGITRENGEMYQRNKMLYLFHTDRFKYMGPITCRPTTMQEIKNLITQQQLEGVIVTDGPHSLTLVPADIALSNPK